MGSIGSSLGGIGGASLGLVGGPLGALAGGALGSSLGSGSIPSIGSLLGTSNNFSANNPIDQAGYQAQIQQLQGQQQGTTAQQQQLANALLAQSQGQGPNPAQSMMQQGLNQNVQQGAGQIASQKGINPGLAARQIEGNTAAQGQQAAGAGAIMGAQQELGAQQQLGGLYNNMGQQNLGNQQLLNNALLGGGLGTQQINANVAGGNQTATTSMIGGLLQGGGAIGASALKGSAGAAAASQGAYIGGKAKVAGDDPKNDTVPAMLSPGEIVIPRSKATDPEAAKAFVEHLLSRKKTKKAA